MKPRDTSDMAWSTQRRVLLAMDPAARVQVAIDLSEAVREIQIQGLLDRHPGLGRIDAVRIIVTRQMGIDLPEYP